MSKVMEYVGVFHVLKDHVKEAWTQFWENSSSNQPNGLAEQCNEKEINFRSRVKVKLEKMRQQSIHVIDSSSNDQEDYSHLTRPKSRRELMQISSAVMGIEFSYAAETAFVSPLLLNIGLRHRHMTLIWCLSPLLGFFLTPILGSLSDGCRSKLGRRRPFIILLSIGIVLGLILVPNGKTIGRMLGDTYADDEPLNLKTSEVAARLLSLPDVLKSPTTESTQIYNQTESLETPKALSNKEFRNRKETQLEQKARDGTDTSSEEIKPSYKLHHSKYMLMENEEGFRARNSLYHKDHDIEENKLFRTLARKHNNPKFKNQDDLKELILKATETKDNDDSKETNYFHRASEMDNSNRKKDETFTNKFGIKPTSKGLELEKESESSSKFDSGNEDAVKSHPWGLVFTVLGTVLLDFDADACQSPSRAYMLDVTIPEDHAKGLSTFTVMAGLGGSIGYFLGALDWDNTFLGELFGGHVRAVFTLVLFIFVACVIATVRSFREIPVDRLWANKPDSGLSMITSGQSTVEPKLVRYNRLVDDSDSTEGNNTSVTSQCQGQKSYGAIHETSFDVTQTNQSTETSASKEKEEAPTFREYVKTIVKLPRSLQWLCATNFFCWMSLVCYSLYFTDFVGEAVFGGDPTAPKGSTLKNKYDEGVRFGCWGMSLYSLSCSVYSLCIESLVERFGARRVYIYGQLVYSVGMVMMAIARHPAGVIIFSWTAGIMYATLFTMPYLLVARYHAAETFDIDVDDLTEQPTQMRGLGTDVAIVSSMVFLAQITQALTLGTIVTVVGTTTVIVCAAAVFATCGAYCATKVLYLDL